MKQKKIKGVIKRKVLVVEYFQLVCCSLLLLMLLFAIVTMTNTEYLNLDGTVGSFALIISILALIMSMVVMLVGIIDSFKKEEIEEEIILNVTGGGGL